MLLAGIRLGKTVKPSFANNLACTTFCFCGFVGTCFKPCCAAGLKVGKKAGKAFWGIGNYCPAKFEKARPAIHERLLQLANQARGGTVFCCCPAERYSFGTAQNSFLSPSSQVRILLWQPVVPNP